jgi:hypothetical protein
MKALSRMGATGIGAFLSHLADENGVAASTGNQALNASVFFMGRISIFVL